MLSPRFFLREMHGITGRKMGRTGENPAKKLLEDERSTMSRIIKKKLIVASTELRDRGKPARVVPNNNYIPLLYVQNTAISPESSADELLAKEIRYPASRRGISPRLLKL